MNITESIKKDIVRWDVEAWSVALHYWENHVDWKKINAALELGSREGGLSLWLALKGIQVVCSDLENPQSVAEKLHTRYNVKQYIVYQSIDATDIPYTNHFDLIVLKSVLGGIGRNNNHARQQQTMHQIHKALKPGGVFLFAENLKASPIHQWARKNFVRWGKEWKYPSLNDMHGLLSVFSKYELKTTGVLSAFGRSERQRQILSKVDKLLLHHLCPDSWKYIAYGIAVK